MNNGRYEILTLREKYTPAQGGGFLRQIRAVFSGWCHYGMVCNHISRQLKKRGVQSRSQWETMGIEDDFLSAVLGIIQRNMGWPNAYYMPDDPMRLLLLSSYPHSDDNAVLLELSEYTDTGFESLINAGIDSMTAGEFVRFCHSQTTKLGGGAGVISSGTDRGETIIPPIFSWEPNALGVYSTREAAEQYFEPWIVQYGLEFFDSMGCRLQAIPDLANYRVRLRKAAETGEDCAESFRSVLLCALSHRDKRPENYEQLSLADMVQWWAENAMDE